MKKCFVYLIMAFVVVAFNACSGDDSLQEEPETEQSEGSSASTDNPGDNDNPNEPGVPDVPSTGNNILIAYFTRTNNTGTIAERITELTGGTLYRIETVVPYPENYTECTEVAREELNNGTRPVLKNTVENME